MDDADGEVDSGGDGADGFSALAAGEDGGALVVVDHRPTAADLDALAGGLQAVQAKGARTEARRRGQVREDFVLESLYWDAGTARLLPRLLTGRTRGPVFVTHRRPGPGKVVSARDVCPMPAWPGWRMGRLVPCWMSTLPAAGRAQTGTRTSCATRPWLASGRPERAC
ncbi:hypothetical protein ACFV1N_35855 [Streptosporangium canum]|uniref:hypothetical protein n=1 Tax=Streptosporangium canum TaxID=324952 RepID=UPI0036CDCD7B